MNALTVVEQDPSVLPALQAVAIRMADEGVPVRAIARSTRISSDDLYMTLRDAIGRGVLVEMPKDDWPLGSSRGARTAFNGTALENEDALKVACAKIFKATRLEAAILSVMFKRTEVTKQQLHQVIEQSRPPGREETDPKMVDVIICHLRKKLKPFGIEIETVWGIGYLISVEGRDLAIRTLTNMSEAPPPAAKVA